MLQFLETGQALYVLAGICLLGIFTRVMTKNLYKRLIKESGNMAATKNKSLKELKQRTENAYRMNQGMRDGGAWLEHQLCELRFRGMTLAGWANLSLQLTWLCLLLGGTGAFFSYWYRFDTFYIVMYGGGAVLMAMLTMLFDNGMAGGKREQLEASLQDYLENVLFPRLERTALEDGIRGDGKDTYRAKVRSIVRVADRTQPAEGSLEYPEEEAQAGQKAAERGRQADRTGQERADRAGNEERTGEGAAIRAVSAGGGKKAGRNGRREAAATVTEFKDEQHGGIRDVDYLKRSLEQIAASRERNKDGDENWMKELGPDEVQLLGDILKEYLA
ncbi:hypothetical protein D3Z51_09525 [Clostridiaceae bacterium]|nr:hypothetical protein [Clostridiaceae bacterium]RKI14090.1 hypothetical protein D7V81_09010 [bacterium 1XD21-70]